MTTERPKAYKDVKVGELLTLLARDYPDNEALVYPDRNLRLTFSQLEDRVRQVAKGLIKLGVQKGDRVGLWATNVPEWVILQYALAKIGAILVTVNTSLRESELEYLLRQSEASVLITIDDFRGISYVETIYNIVPELKESDETGFRSGQLPNLRSVIYLNDVDPRQPKGMIHFDRLTAMADEVDDKELIEREALLDLDEVINMQYTSGTTGFPKGVMLSHRNIVNNGYWLAEGLGYTPDDRLCSPVPFFHCFGCVIAVLGAHTHAACLVPLECFDPHKVLELVQNEQCTALYGVPTMFLAELEDPDFDKFDLSTLRTGVMAGALCPEPLMRRVISEMHCQEITIAYGLTESSPGITQTLRDDTIQNRTQTVGKVMPELEVKIIDPITLADLPIGTPGELVVRGYNVMKGYYNNPTATAAALITLDGKSGWLRSGDQATIDHTGYVRITGRIKDIIIRGGENISPKEVEDLIRTHPDVFDVYVYSVPSEKWGEEVAAAIKLKNDCTCTPEQIREFCRGKIAKFKIPNQVRFVNEFPMTASGKVQKFKLREQHLAAAAS
ncbi:MAG TPA: AMP-binding protein [Blastocatellia bacterium]|nr:AMP-binding protein [Blastocatellia bacterium]